MEVSPIRCLLSLVSAMLLAGLMLVPTVPALAVTDTTDVSGNVTQSIQLTPPSAFSLGSMTIGDYPTNEATSGNGTVECNVTPWTLVVEDNSWAIYAGCMHVGTDNLTNAIQVQDKDTAFEVMDAGGVIRLDAQPVGSINFQLTVRQKIVYGDVATTGYSITLKLTATY